MFIVVTDPPGLVIWRSSTHSVVRFYIAGVLLAKAHIRLIRVYPRIFRSRAAMISILSISYFESEYHIIDTSPSVHSQTAKVNNHD
jgi:hypothetical protein